MRIVEKKRKMRAIPDNILMGDTRDCMSYLQMPAATAALQKKWPSLDMDRAINLLQSVLTRMLTGRRMPYVGPRWIGYFVKDIGDATGWWETFWNPYDLSTEYRWVGAFYVPKRGAPKQKRVSADFRPRWNAVRFSQWRVVRLVLARRGLCKDVSLMIFRMSGGWSNALTIRAKRI